MQMRLILILAAAFGSIAPHGAVAQTYPSRPVTMIVPFPAGGPTDAVGRIVAAGLQAALHQPVVVENIPGAAGSLGTGVAARAKPDGYTLALGNSVTHVVNGAVYPLSYDVVTAFAPIALLVNDTTIVVSKKAVPADNLHDLIGWLKAKPGALVGTGGIGTGSHVGGLLFAKLAGVQLQFVPYRGLGPAIQDLVTGQIDIVMSLPANALPQIRAGSIKAFAVAAKKRLAAAPDIPTVDEAGLPGFYHSNWHALFAPKGTPKQIVDRLNDAAATALADPAVRQRLNNLGEETFPREEQTPAALAAFQKTEIETRWPILKAAGIKAK
jgi:tripartite-type tricarboxylate transporter receptor subunit TctC